jgi:hypothetical protein
MVIGKHSGAAKNRARQAFAPRNEIPSPDSTDACFTLWRQPLKSHNSASPKLPELDVSLSAIGIPPSSYRSMPAAYHGAKDMYEFIVRQLLAGG